MLINSNTNHLLLKRLQEDDYDAFSSIYQLYSDELYHYSKKINLNIPDAEDAIQEVFASLWIRRKKLQILDLKSWLYASLRKQMLNQLRKNKYKTTLHENLLSLVKSDINFVSGIYSSITLKEMHAAVEAELSKLSPQKKLIYNLSRNEFKSHKQIAKELNISELTVKKQINTVLKIFKEKLIFKYFFTFLYYLLFAHATSL